MLFSLQAIDKYPYFNVFPVSKMSQNPCMPDVDSCLSKAVQETIQVGLMISDPVSGNIIYVNNKLCELFGWSAGELLLMDFTRLLCEGEDSDIWKYTVDDKVIKFRSRNGSVIWGLMSSNRLRDKNGNEQGILYSITDITRRKHVEQQLQQSQKRLRLLTKKLIHAQEAVQKRIAGELHDGIGSNINAARLMLERRIAAAGDEDNSLLGIVDLLKTISADTRRISRNLHPSIIEDIGLIAAVNSIVREFSALQPDMVFHQNISFDEDQIRNSFKLNLYRILQEALNNIMKHSGAKTVDIQCRITGKTLELSISDDGCGFDPGRVLHNEDSDTTGLGMESMKERATFCNGSLTVESGVGRGSMICVKIPV